MSRPDLERAKRHLRTAKSLVLCGLRQAALEELRLMEAELNGTPGTEDERLIVWGPGGPKNYPASP